MEAPIKPEWLQEERPVIISKSQQKLKKKKKSVKKGSSSSSDYEGYTGSISKSGKPDKRTKEYKRWKKDKKTRKVKSRTREQADPYDTTPMMVPPTKPPPGFSAPKKFADSKVKKKKANNFGWVQSYNEGIRQDKEPYYTSLKDLARASQYFNTDREEMVAPKKEKKVVPPGARSRFTVPHGVDFMPIDEWDGIIDGFVFKNADKGMGYYRKGITNEGGVKVLKDFFELPDENKGQQTPFRDMSISEARNYKLKTPVKPTKRDNEHKGRRYHQQQKEMNLKKTQDLQETAKKAITERENEHKGRRYHQQQKEMNLKKMQDLQETAKKAIKERENEHKGRRYQSTTEKVKAIKEREKVKAIKEREQVKAIKEREQVKPQEINWADFYGKQTPGHPLYEDPKKVVQDISSDEEDELSMFGLLATPGVSELYSYDNEKLKKMVIVAGVPIEDIVAMDFNKDIKEQLIGLLNR